MGTLHHHPMEVHVALKELRQALFTLITPETTREGITSLTIPEFILIISMLLIMVINHGIRKLIIFVVYITMPLLSVGKEWQHKGGWGMKSLFHNREINWLSRHGVRRLTVVVATEVAIKEPRVRGSIQSSTLRMKRRCMNHSKPFFDKKMCHKEMIHSLW